MDRPRMLLHARRLALLALLVVASAVAATAQSAGDGAGDDASEAGAAPPSIYKWVDENGIAHYTTDFRKVPRSLRGLLGTTRREAESTTRREAESPNRASVAAPRSSIGADRWAETDRAQEVDEAYGGPWSDGTEVGGVVDPEAGERIDPVAVERARRELEERIAELQRDIASDEDALKDILAVAPSDTAEIAYDPEFRAVAERLPKLLAELRTLEDERDQLETP